MNEPFILPVTYQGTEHELKARFERWGYTHRIAVLINEFTYNFEPDEEGSYRVLTVSDQAEKTEIDRAFLKAVVEKLVSLSN